MSLLKNDFFDLSSVSKSALDRRIDISDEYTVNEISVVSSRSERLFPTDFEISKEETENFRVLARHTKLEMSLRNITSHRKYVGPAIVFCKKIILKLVGVILKDTLIAQEIFNRHTIKILARQSSNKRE